MSEKDMGYRVGGKIVITEKKDRYASWIIALIIVLILALFVFVYGIAHVIGHVAFPSSGNGTSAPAATKASLVSPTIHAQAFV
jgi:hypothetical protein